MPYLKQEDRNYIDQGGEPRNAGEFNYALFQIARAYFEDHGSNYQAWNDIAGAIELSKQEIYRRCVGPYEDSKIIENGDILPYDLAWAAGFFDGEGSVHCSKSPDTRNRGSLPRRQVVLQLGQKTPLLLLRFQEAVGVKCAIQFRDTGGPTKDKTFYCLCIGRYQGVAEVIRMLWPFLGLPKREQSLVAMKEYVNFRNEHKAHRKWKDEILELSELPATAMDDWPE